MRIFNLVIMKKQWLNYEKTKSFGEGFTKGVEHSFFVKIHIMKELERLKNDHWDKDAFDRIIELMKRE